MTADRKDLRWFFGIVILIFITSSVVTVLWCSSMSAMPEMPMPGGWCMSMTWMLMPGQSWLNATILFLAMWDVMMLAMMTPSLAPMLLRYRQAVESTPRQRLGWLTTVAGLAYFFVWTIVGLVGFPIGIGFNALLMQHKNLSMLVPVAVGITVLAAGLLQFSKWKLHQLACCRALPFHGQKVSANASMAWKHGLHLGLQCCRCTAGLMFTLLVTGVMNVFIMAIITVAITAERLAPARKWVPRTIGVIGIAAGCFMIARAMEIF